MRTFGLFGEWYHSPLTILHFTMAVLPLVTGCTVEGSPDREALREYMVSNVMKRLSEALNHLFAKSEPLLADLP